MISNNLQKNTHLGPRQILGVRIGLAGMKPLASVNHPQKNNSSSSQKWMAVSWMASSPRLRTDHLARLFAGLEQPLRNPDR
jgi:hypothetical protein